MPGDWYKNCSKKAAGSDTPATSSAELDEYIGKLREAITHEKSAERLRAEAQQVQDQMTYLVTICGIELTATNLHPNTLQLIQHGQYLLSKAQEQVRAVPLQKFTCMLNPMLHSFNFFLYWLGFSSKADPEK